MKKEIKIAHLYYDLLNLYGESGNIKVLKGFIERAGVDAEVHFLTIGDKIDFDAYDFYYLGEGSEENQRLVLNDIKKYKKDIKKAIDKGKVFLATGNSMELFGQSIRLQSGISLECLGIFDYKAFEEKERLVSDIIYECDKLPKEGKYFVAFKNCNCNIVNNDKYRFCEFADTFNKNNFFGMNLIGPVLARNPYFTNYILEILFKQKNIDAKLRTDTIEFDAYNDYVENFIKNADI